MYCQDCGYPNPDNATQCARCGTQIVETPPPDPRNKDLQALNTFDFKRLASDMKNVKDKTKGAIDKAGNKVSSIDTEKHKNTFIIFGCIAAVVVAILIFVGIGSSATDPEKIALKYFASYVSGNYEQMYSYLDIQGSDYISQEAFVAFMSTQNNTMKNVSSFAIDDTFKKFNDDMNELTSALSLTKSYCIRYVASGDSSEQTYLVTLTKSGDKAFLFFDKYCVSDSNIPLATNIVIYTPANATISMDGIPLGNPKKPQETGNNLNEYAIPEAIGGKHSFTISGPTYVDTTVECELEKEQVYNLSAPLNDAALQNFKAIGDSVIKAFFIGAVVHKNFDELGLNSNLRSAYAEQGQSFDGSNMKGINITSIEYQDYSTTKDGNIRAKVSYQYSYEYSGEIRQYDTSKNITLGFYYDEASNLIINSIDGRM